MTSPGRAPERYADESVEPRIRRVVAEQLGLGLEDLSPCVSLADDLATDSLDLLELAVGLEEDFDIEIPESKIAGVRTYEELVDCVGNLHRLRGARADLKNERKPVPVSVRIVPAAGNGGGELWRVCALTSYNRQTIVEDAMYAGPGAHLEVSVPRAISDRVLRKLDDQLAGLRARNIQVSVCRQLSMCPVDLSSTAPV